MQAIVNQLTTIVEAYTEKFMQLPDEALTQLPAPGKWSKKEVIGHLVDSAQNNIQRFIRAQYEQPHIVYNQDVWVNAQHYRTYPTADLISLWRLLNLHLCNVLRHMPAASYSHEVRMGLNGETTYTVQYLAEDYLVHLLHHLEEFNT